MTRRSKLVLAAIAIGLPAAYLVPRVGYPRYMRWKTHAELERAASNLCACMLGTRGGDLDSTLRSTRIGTFLHPSEKAWPSRCAPWGDQAIAAYERAWKWDDLPDPPSKDYVRPWAYSLFLESIQPFWVRDPDPDVPIPERASLAIGSPSKLVGLLPVRDTNQDDTPTLRIENGKLLVTSEDTVVIHADDHVERLDSPRLRAHPDWRPLESEPGAKRYFFDRSYIVDEQSHRLVPSWALNITWGRSYANGRVLAIAADGDHMGDDMLWDVSPSGTVTKTPTEIPVSRSTVFLDDGWVLYKALDKGEATVTALDLSTGAAAKRIPLGHVAKPSRGLARSYGPCIGKATFVDMDPSLAVRVDGAWTLLDLEQPMERHLTCDGDAAIVTELFPLEIRRCTQGGCTKIPYPSPSFGPLDRYAADEHNLFHLELVDGMLFMSIHSLSNPADVHRAALLTDIPKWRWPAPMRIVAGRAIVLLERPRQGNEEHATWAAVSVRPDGSVAIVGAK